MRPDSTFPGERQDYDHLANGTEADRAEFIQREREHGIRCAAVTGGDAGDCECERFDEHAIDLDAWRADQERIRSAESAQHARIDRALAPWSSALDAPGSPVALEIPICPVCHLPAHASESDDLDRHEGCQDILPERSAARDSWTLDRIAELLHSDTRPWGLDLEREVLELLRSTGRTC